MEIQPTRSTSLRWSMGTVGEKLQESNVGDRCNAFLHAMQCWGTDQSPWTFFQQRCVLLSRH